MQLRQLVKEVFPADNEVIDYNLGEDNETYLSKLTPSCENGDYTVKQPEVGFENIQHTLVLHIL